MNLDSKQSPKGHLHETMKWRGKVEGVLYGPDGEVKERFESQENLIVDLGFENITDHLTAGTGNALTHLGIGWAEPDLTPGVPAAGDLNLPMPGGTPPLVGGMQKRFAAVMTKIDEYNFKLVGTIGPTEPSNATIWPVPIRSVGLFWATGVADSEMFSWILRAVMNKASVDSLVLTYTITGS